MPRKLITVLASGAVPRATTTFASLTTFERASSVLSEASPAPTPNAELGARRLVIMTTVSALLQAVFAVAVRVVEVVHRRRSHYAHRPRRAA